MTLVDGSGVLEEVLVGRRGARGVRELVMRPLEHGARELLDEGGLTRVPSSLEPLRSKFKPSRKLTAYYRTPVEDVGGASFIAASWTLEPNGVRTTVLVAPADPSMPQLERLSDPHHVAALVESLTGRSAPLLGRGAVRTLRYRPGQRHVLAVPFASGDVYVKTDRDRSGALAVERATMLREAVARRCPPVRIVQPIGWVAEDSAALWCEVPGRPLSQLLSGRRGHRTAAVEQVGRALRALHEATTGAPLPTASAAGSLEPRTEAASVQRAGEHVTALLPRVGSLYRVLVGEALEALERLPAEPPVIAHGDFKGDNLLIDGGHPSVLDLDRTCVAEPATDLGKLLADLAWWCPDPAASRVLDASLRVGYGPCNPIRWVRAELWAVLFALKIAARRCAVHEPDWEPEVRRRVEAAADLLSVPRRG